MRSSSHGTLTPLGASRRSRPPLESVPLYGPLHEAKAEPGRARHYERAIAQLELRLDPLADLQHLGVGKNST
jgi:hypothetical protein